MRNIMFGLCLLLTACGQQASASVQPTPAGGDLSAAATAYFQCMDTRAKWLTDAPTRRTFPTQPDCTVLEQQYNRLATLSPR